MHRSLPSLYPPFHIHATGGKLDRVERLSTGHTIDLILSRVQTGLVLQTRAQLLGSEIEECSQKVWRMLRLDESLQVFRRIAQRTPDLASVTQWGARYLRGATLFEDIITAVIVTWQTEGVPSYDKLIWLVNRYGDPLPSNPTLHAFPQPEQIAAKNAKLSQQLPVKLAECLTWIARVFLEQGHQIDMLTRSLIDLEQLESRLTQRLHIPPESMGLVMLKLGRYDYVPTDAWACHRVHQYQAQHHHNGATAQDVRNFFEPWHPWEGLAYWCWDWPKTPVSNHIDIPALVENDAR